MHRLIPATVVALASLTVAPPAAAATSELQALQSALTALGARVARLERANTELVPGIYRVHGLQTELGAGAGFGRVDVNTWGGTITFNPDGTFRSVGSATGSDLFFNLCCLPGSTVRETEENEKEKGRGRWTLEGNRLTVKYKGGSTATYSGAGNLFVGASSNLVDGTSVMLVLVREEP